MGSHGYLLHSLSPGSHGGYTGQLTVAQAGFGFFLIKIHHTLVYFTLH